MVQCGANRRPRREGSMREYSIETIDYRIDIADRIRRALRGAEGVGVKGEGQKAAIRKTVLSGRRQPRHRRKRAGAEHCKAHS